MKNAVCEYNNVRFVFYNDSESGYVNLRLECVSCGHRITELHSRRSMRDVKYYAKQHARCGR